MFRPGFPRLSHLGLAHATPSTGFMAQVYRGPGEADRSTASGASAKILAYLKNYEPEVGVAAGILLYPTIDQDFTFTYRILGHLVRVCSVNLMQPWLVIHHRLLEVLNLVTAPS
jgi:hypothetical protein